MANPRFVEMSRRRGFHRKQNGLASLLMSHRLQYTATAIEMESDPVIAGGACPSSSCKLLKSLLIVCDVARSGKKTIFVGNLAGAVNETQLIEAFTTFGEGSKVQEDESTR